jgi:Carboxypeptidase regulatory-like domain
MPGVAPRVSAPISCRSKTAHHRKQTLRAGLAAQGAFGAKLARQGDWGRLARALRTAPLCDIVQPTWVKVRRVDAPFASGRRVGVADRFRLCTNVWGEITGGEVRDQSGAAASNAAVTVTNLETSASRSTTTNDAGVYSFPSLVPEAIRFGSCSQGFQPEVRTSIDLQVRQAARVDFTLTVGSSAQAMKVAGAPVARG